MAKEQFVLPADETLDWQREDAVGVLGTVEDIAAGNAMGQRIDMDNDEDNGL